MNLRILPSDHILIRVRAVEIPRKKNTCEICHECTSHALLNGARVCKTCFYALTDAFAALERKERT